MAACLALLSFVKLSLSDGVTLSYRESEQWSSTASIFVTQPGFPLGRSIYDEVVPVEAEGSQGSYVPRFADPSRFSTYAQLYARLASSDLLRARMLRDGPLQGAVSAAPAVDPRNPGIFLPLVEIQGLATTSSGARTTAARATEALRTYVKEEQASNGIAPDRRVVLRLLNDPSPPVLIVARSKTKPAFIFMAVLIAFAALIFVLENLRPHVRVARRDDQDLDLRSKSRRSA